MSIEVKVPQLPESVADAVLGAWHKQEGERVARDENLVDLETDKVVLEVPAPRSGVLKSIQIQNGATVKAGDVLAIVEEGDEGSQEQAADAGAAAEKAEPARKANGDGGQAGQSKADGAKAKESSETRKEAPAESSGNGAAHKLSPAVRRLAEQHDLDPGSVAGSGRDGRVTKGDVLAALDREKAPAEAPKKPAPQAEGGDREPRRVPMTRLRKRIAERLVQAQQNAAMLTTFNEVDLTEVMKLRARYRDGFEKQHGVRLGFMSFFVKAALESLRRFPEVNASIEGDDILYHDYYDIGIAVSTERGLLVPVLRDADLLSFAEVETAITDFGQRARKNQITMEELTGGTFTITNGGIFGSLLSTPILNPPQSAILGMHKIQERPVVVDGQIVVRSMMYIALSYDHRIIDGREAVQFLAAIKDSLEDPARLLLQI